MHPAPSNRVAVNAAFLSPVDEADKDSYPPRHWAGGGCNNARLETLSVSLAPDHLLPWCCTCNSQYTCTYVHTYMHLLTWCHVAATQDGPKWSSLFSAASTVYLYPYRYMYPYIYILYTNSVCSYCLHSSHWLGRGLVWHPAGLLWAWRESGNTGHQVEGWGEATWLCLQGLPCLHVATKVLTFAGCFNHGRTYVCTIYCIKYV